MESYLEKLIPVLTWLHHKSSTSLSLGAYISLGLPSSPIPPPAPPMLKLLLPPLKLPAPAAPPLLAP